VRVDGVGYVLRLSLARVFEDERHRISAALSDRAVARERVGSTSVPGLAAKPVLDIAIAVVTFERERALMP